VSGYDFLLAQVFFCKKKKCVDVRGMFDGGKAKRKGFYLVNTLWLATGLQPQRLVYGN
jgi:hypothetical protein